MNRGIFIFLGAVVLIGSAGLYLLKHGPALFVGRPPAERIVFVSTRGGQVDIWTMNADGSDKVAITDDPADDTSPAWNPDGTEILSASNRESDRHEIYVSSWSGGYTKRLTNSSGAKDFPDWGPGGKEMVFISSGTVHLLPRFGGDDLQIMPTVEQGVTHQNPPYTAVRWSPVERSLAVVQDLDMRQLAMVREDVDNPERNPVGLDVDEEGSSIPLIAGSISLDWSKQGYRLAASFIDRRVRGGKSINGIRIADISSMSFEDILVTEGDSTGPGALKWSPDGKQIAFEMWEVRKGRMDRCVGLYVVSANGGKPRLLLKGEAMEPTWSPDGLFLACTLPREDGKRDIWRVAVDGADPTNLTDGEGDNFQPKWSPAVKKR